jgi:hypothetical protein
MIYLLAGQKGGQYTARCSDLHARSLRVWFQDWCYVVVVHIAAAEPETTFTRPMPWAWKYNSTLWETQSHLINCASNFWWKFKKAEFAFSFRLQPFA